MWSQVGAALGALGAATLGLALFQRLRRVRWRLPAPYEAILIHLLCDDRLAPLQRASEAVKDGIDAFIRRTTAGRHRPLDGPRTQRLFEGKIQGSESVAVSPSGRLTMLDKFGYVHHAVPNADGHYVLQDGDPPLYIGPGRPLGFQYVGEDILLVCDSLKGLLEVDLQRRQIRVLANTAGGVPINFANDLDCSPDGEWVYFSSSTRGVVAHHPDGFYDTMWSYLLNLYAADVSGRLLRHHRPTGRTEVLMDGLWFANGVAVAPSGDFVLVAETSGARVLRYWLAGPKKGHSEVFIDSLPGWPDNIAATSDGNFWVCLVTPMAKGVAAFQLGLVRFICAWLQVLGWLPAPPKWGCVLKVSPGGTVLEVLLDPTGRAVAGVSCVAEHGGKLFLANVSGDYVSVHHL